MTMLMNYVDQIKLQLKNNYVPLKVQIQTNKTIFSIERNIQKLMKEKKK